MRREYAPKRFHPSFGVENMLQDEVVSGIRIGRERCMEAVEEGGARVGPCEVAFAKAFKGQDICITKMVDRDMPEWLFDTRLQRAGDRRLAAAGSTVKENYLCRHPVCPPAANAGRNIREEVPDRKAALGA